MVKFLELLQLANEKIFLQTDDLTENNKSTFSL